MIFARMGVCIGKVGSWICVGCLKKYLGIFASPRFLPLSGICTFSSVRCWRNWAISASAVGSVFALRIVSRAPRPSVLRSAITLNYESSGVFSFRCVYMWVSSISFTISRRGKLIAFMLSPLTIFAAVFDRPFPLRGRRFRLWWSLGVVSPGPYYFEKQRAVLIRRGTRGYGTKERFTYGGFLTRPLIFRLPTSMLDIRPLYAKNEIACGQ